MRNLPKSVSLDLPFGVGGVSVDVSVESADAAWSLYVEYSTRIASVGLQRGTGSVREALEALHSLFGVTREILKAKGLAVTSEGEHESVGTIAIRILNEGIRPHLARWHTSLAEFEAATWRSWIGQGHALPDHPRLALALVDESKWSEYEVFYDQLPALQHELELYVDAFARMAGVERAGSEERETRR